MKLLGRDLRSSLFGLAAGLALAACSRAPADPDAIVRTLSIGDMAPGLDPVGVAFDDVDREVLILDTQSRVLVFDEEGTLLSEHDLSTVGWGFSAIAAIPGTSEVLITSPASITGYRIDLDSLQIAYTFCLLPDEGPVEIVQMQEFGIAFDEDSDRIVVAPYWTNTETGEITSSALETYDGATGYLVDWQDLDGLTVEALDIDASTGEVRLVDDGVLYRWIPGEGSSLGHTEELQNLSRDLGVGILRSFARDRSTEHHWLLDLGEMVVIEAR